MAVIINNLVFAGFLPDHITAIHQCQFSSIFNKSDSNASFEWIITDSGTSPFLFGSFQAHLWSKHVSTAEHGYTDTTKWEESTKPGLIRVSKLQQPCLTLIDLYQNTGIHGGQMQAHFAECSTEEEVNKHSLIRLHQGSSYHSF